MREKRPASPADAEAGPFLCAMRRNGPVSPLHGRGKPSGVVAGTLDGRPGSGAYRPRRDQMRITPQLLAAVVNRAGTSEALR